MSSYSCRRCGYSSEVKGNLVRHLSRKTMCVAVLDPIDAEVHLRELRGDEKRRPFGCRTCGITFTCRQNRCRHERECADLHATLKVQQLERIVAQQQDALAKQQMEIDSIKHQAAMPPATIRINNIQNNVIIAVQLRDFDQENTAAIPPSLLRDLIMNVKIRELIENLHFDPDFPENHNVRLVSLKRELMEMYRGDRWNTMPLKTGMTEVIKQACRIFRRFYQENRGEVEEDVGDPEETCKIMDHLEAIENDNVDKRVMRPYHEEMRALLVGGKAAGPCALSVGM